VTDRGFFKKKKGGRHLSVTSNCLSLAPLESKADDLQIIRTHHEYSCEIREISPSWLYTSVRNEACESVTIYWTSHMLMWGKGRFHEALSHGRTLSQWVVMEEKLISRGFLIWEDPTSHILWRKIICYVPLCEEVLNKVHLNLDLSKIIEWNNLTLRPLY
jgi:hypothetical protein